MAPTLYQAVLGERFDALPGALRQFHAAPAGARARGALAVRRGRGPLARLAAWFISAPPVGDAIPVELRVELEPTGERWVRQFDGKPMITRQWQTDAMLVEALSLSRLYFELRVVDGAMVFEQRRCELLGIPLPGFLSPRVEARAGACPPDSPRVDNSARAWDLCVRISLPIIGLVCEYAGVMERQDD